MEYYAYQTKTKWNHWDKNMANWLPAYQLAVL